MEVFEYAFGEFDCRCRHGDGVLANGGVGPYVFGDGKTFFKPLAQLGAHGVGLECDARGLLHLT